VTATQSAPRPDPSGPGTTPVTGRSRLGLALRVLGGVIVVASFGIWVYGFTGAARRDPPDLLSDPSFAQQAEAICQSALDDVALMPGALEALDGPDRGRQVEAATARYEEMLDELDQLVGGSEHDVEIQTGWLSDWRVLISDRYRYAAAVAEDPGAQYLVTDIGVSERLDKRITRVANTNSMPACVTPTDAG
jgi:hypothetical protein